MKKKYDWNTIDQELRDGKEKTGVSERHGVPVQRITERLRILGLVAKTGLRRGKYG